MNYPALFTFKNRYDHRLTAVFFDECHARVTKSNWAAFPIGHIFEGNERHNETYYPDGGWRQVKGVWVDAMGVAHKEVT